MMFTMFHGRKREHDCMRGRRGGRGPGGFGMPEWGNEWRARRGDIKFLLLETLAEGPMHGYEVIQRLSERHEGRYRPSPGSVYPTLQMLEEGGFLTGELTNGKRVYTITDSGRQLLEERTTTGEDEPESAEASDWRKLRKSGFAFIMAAREGLHHADPATRERVRAVLDRTRREIYAILAEEE